MPTLPSRLAAALLLAFAALLSAAAPVPPAPDRPRKDAGPDAVRQALEQTLTLEFAVAAFELVEPRSRWL